MIIKLSKNSGEEWIAAVRRHITKRAKVKRQGENTKSSKGKTTSDMQGNCHKNIS